MENIRNSFRSWKVYEVAWLISATIIILILSLYWGDTPVGIISALTGVVCVILTAKGKISCYAWGLVNSALYAYIGFQNKYYGEFMLNLFYYVPMQFVGYMAWRKNMNKETETIKARMMTNRDKIIALIISIIGIAVWGMWLKHLGGELPFIDATTNVLSIMAMLLSIKRYAEQWILWIIINIISVGMWIHAMAIGSDNIATLIMWSVYLINSIWGYIKWRNDSIKELNTEDKGSWTDKKAGKQ